MKALTLSFGMEGDRQAHLTEVEIEGPTGTARYTRPGTPCPVCGGSLWEADGDDRTVCTNCDEGPDVELLALWKW
jgi:ribosomal protein S27AE